ncbi:MAG TPA: MmgE/PrpD family protein [Usitatibacter sp.]|nr:MmgE/PrpD family protein [Usitatibacter sp.]
MTALSTYMSNAAHAPLPADVEEAAKHHLLDTIAAMVSGSQLAPGQAALRFARSRMSRGRATIVASALTADAPGAALANGVMAHSDETDDSHERSRSHPGCAVVPAALAAGEEFGIDGAHFLRAVALGYDVGPRVAIAMGGPRFSYESHKSTHAIGGVFGAAAAAGCAASLDAQQMRWLLDYTSQQSAGIAAWQRDKDHIEKAFVFAGMPARNGVTAALLVQDGWNGVNDIFTGADNFFLAYAPDADLSKVSDKLGERYEIANTDIKRWTVGSPIQAPLDAVEAIRKRRPFESSQVERVTVRLAPSTAAVVDNRDIPDICLQHMVAVMLLDGTASFQAAHDKARMQDAAVLRERAKVQLIPDEELAKLLPVRVTVVEIAFSDGTRLAERVEAVRGTVRNPMSRAEVVEKCRDLTEPVLGASQAKRLIDAVLSIETVKDIRALRPLLQRPNAALSPFMDCHVHMDKAAGERSIEDAVRAMPIENAAMYLFLPSPFPERSALSFDIEEIQAAARNFPGKVATLGGGGTLNPMIQEAVKAGSVSAELEARFRARALEIEKLGAAGFGELAAEHKPSESTPSIQSLPPDHPLLVLLMDIAADARMPITLHMEATQGNIAPFERLLTHNERARLVWAHGGWDNTGLRTPRLCRLLLSAHPNLFMELKIDPRNPGLNSPLTEGASGKVKPEWLSLFGDFPERFVMGSDQHYPMPGDAVQRWQGIVALFNELPAELRRAFGLDNPRRIYRLPA